MKQYFLRKTLISLKLRDPIHETGFPKLGFITILCLKFRALDLKPGFKNLERQSCKYQYSW